ncbi:hypothetical protein [Ferruginibacter sp. SUN106]|uniref:hypothetical protein n=1 Tax=Ferruginibacter sp. SUN106 TaxID=2978348 RepID=UPI003D36626C
MATNEKVINFEIAFEASDIKIHCLPVDIFYEAHLLSRNGIIIQSVAVQKGKFSFAVSPEELKASRLVLAPVNPQLSKERKTGISTAAAMLDKRVTYEPVLPDKPAQTIILPDVPVAIWKYWCYCTCRVRGRVFNYCHGTYQPVYHAKVHVCEVDPIWLWLRRLPDEAILRIKDSILHPEIIERPPHIPVGPGPVELNMEGRMMPENMEMMVAGLKSRMTSDTAASATALPQQNIAILHTESVHLIREYLVANYQLLYPWWCYWIPIYWWWWYSCDEITTILTNEQGWFDRNIYYNCFGDRPDLYFWVEYNINGVWTTIYNPPIHCNTYWDYVCGTEVDIYLHDERIHCPGDPTVPGKVVIVSTLGNNVNVNRVQQSAGTNQGLAPDLGYGYTNFGPFGGSVEPHVYFGEQLIPSGIKFYRWSYINVDNYDSSNPDAGWFVMNDSVDRHYIHTNPDLSLSSPVYNLGPKTGFANNDLFEIQTARQPVTNEPWNHQASDARNDTATAFFNTGKLAPVLAGMYYIKMEFFNAAGVRVNLTDLGIDLQVPSALQPAPFGNSTINFVAAPAINRLLDGGGKLLGFKMVINVDNNPTTAKIDETKVGLQFAGPCGMITYFDKATDVAHIGFTASHPNDHAFFSFTITKGSSGTVHSVNGTVGNNPPVSVFDNGAVSVEPYIYTGGAIDRFDTNKHVSVLLGACDEGAFAESLSVYGTATDGWGRIGYDDGKVMAFALKH